MLHIYQAEVVLLMESVPLALTQILGGFAAALEAVSPCLSSAAVSADRERIEATAAPYAPYPNCLQCSSEVACVQAGVPAAAAPSYAVSQWAQCGLFPAPQGSEFCAWAATEAHVPSPYNKLDVALATQLLGSFQGNLSKYTAT